MTERLRLLQGGLGRDDVMRPVLPAAPILTKAMPAADGQFVLPFGDAAAVDLMVAIVPMEQIHGERFHAAFDKIRPKVVIDLRHAIRFDLPGTNRLAIFRLFSKVQTFYTIASLPWHQLEARRLMTENWDLSERLTHEVLERRQSPVMLLVPLTEHAIMLRSYLNRVLNERAKISWCMEQIN
jgi:hypothetical protein